MNQLRDFDRAESVRLRRMKDCFEADRPDSAEVLSAIRRWNQFESRQRPGLSLRAAWVVAAAMMLSGGAMAASSVLKLPSWSAFGSNSKQAQPTAKLPSHIHTQAIMSWSAAVVACNTVNQQSLLCCRENTPPSSLTIPERNGSDLALRKFRQLHRRPVGSPGSSRKFGCPSSKCASHCLQTQTIFPRVPSKQRSRWTMLRQFDNRLRFDPGLGFCLSDTWTTPRPMPRTR